MELPRRVEQAGGAANALPDFVWVVAAEAATSVASRSFYAYGETPKRETPRQAWGRQGVASQSDGAVRHASEAAHDGVFI